jgi:CheY-like chemotaxis protein
VNGVRQRVTQGVQTILIVDDDPAVVRLMSLLLKSEDFSVLEAHSGQQALSLLSVNEPDLIVLDLSMPGMDGRDFYPRARLLGYEGPIVVCSAYGAEAARRDLGAQASLEKPFDPDTLISLIADLLRTE